MQSFLQDVTKETTFEKVIGEVKHQKQIVQPEKPKPVEEKKAGRSSSKRPLSGG